MQAAKFIGDPMKLDSVKQALDSLAAQCESCDHEVLILAEDSENESALNIVAHTLLTVSQLLKVASAEINVLAATSVNIDQQTIEEMTALAEEFDKSGDPILQKQAYVIDQILINMANSGMTKEAKRDVEKLYDLSPEMHKAFGGDAMVKAFHDKIKEYRPMEAPLTTRTCPDHPGAQIKRVDDGKFQCSLDNKIYDYNEGFTTMKGNKIPGGDVALQTKTMHDTLGKEMGFSTRSDLMTGY